MTAPNTDLLALAEQADRYASNPLAIEYEPRHVREFIGETAIALRTAATHEAEIPRLREALEAIAGFGQCDLSGEWPQSLRDIIRSQVDCARRALTTPDSK